MAAAALDHLGKHGRHTVGDAEQVDLDLSVKVLGTEIEGRIVPADARVGDQDVDRTQLAAQVERGVADCPGIGDVGDPPGCSLAA